MAKEQPKGKVVASPVVDISADIERFAEIGVLGTLLADRSTGGNIIWASNVFSDKGESYAPEDEIYVADVTGENAGIIRARASKNRDDQVALTRAHAEVFTPYWIVKKMVDWADEAWYAQREASPHLWRDYVRSPRLEITCGEAPYLVTRYDAADGTRIPVYRRCGVLDRKLIQIIEHVRSRSSWLRHATVALKSTYGYEYQGDNLLIARVNVLATMEDFCDTAGWDPLTPDEYKALVEIISWNLWQMDGLDDCVPNGALGSDNTYELRMPDPDATKGQMEMGIALGRGVARIYDWEHAHEMDFGTLKREVTLMDNGPRIKFDYVIGNPPYMEETAGTSDKPIYHRFMDEAYETSDRVLLITPARFLFKVGKTPKAWNEKMLADKHFKVLEYYQDSQDVFPNNLVNGGIAITYRDANADFGSIETFSQFNELMTILRKVRKTGDITGLDSIAYQQNKWDLDALYLDYPEFRNIIGSNGRERRLTAPILANIPLFHEEPNEGDIAIYGLVNSKRTLRYISPAYLDQTRTNLHGWKVVMSTANGAAGTIGKPIPARIAGKSTVLSPGTGYTQTFIGFGCFDTQTEAESLKKYLETRFARTMLGILKITQDNKTAVWRYVPIQDWTTRSDIDWSAEVDEIDFQLYSKYGLTNEEIHFLNEYVAEME